MTRVDQPIESVAPRARGPHPQRPCRTLVSVPDMGISMSGDHPDGRHVYAR
ncbi:hypothetical protein [Streptomyces sp. NPDC057617]|uniref:hypothetical protein n=1 Tax=Streptomyces sp. NPDC057617 TaxID=3346184 RepID=UPI00368DBA4A